MKFSKIGIFCICMAVYLLAVIFSWHFLPLTKGEGFVIAAFASFSVGMLFRTFRFAMSRAFFEVTPRKD